MTHILLPHHTPDQCANLFVASSGYHIILAHALAANPEMAPGASILVIKRSRKPRNLEELFQCIRDDPATPFRHVYILEQDSDARWRDLHHLRRAQALDALAESAQTQCLFVFSEDVISQHVARRTRSRGGTVYGVEDGAIAYSDQLIQHGLARRIRSKIFFGPTTSRVPVAGAASYIDKFIARYPRHLRNELRSRPVITLPATGLQVLDKLRWPAALLSLINVDADRLNYEVVVLLAHHKNFESIDEYPERIREAISQLLEKTSQVAVSYHPREAERDWLKLEALGATLIPNSVPSELLYLFNREKLQAVYGDIGTSLMTARWMLPDAAVTSWMDRLGIHDMGNTRGMFQDIGIEIR